MCGLTLQAADAIVQGALAKARELRCSPMTVAVVDAGGAAIVLKREDGSGALRPDIAFAKAWGPIGMGIGRVLVSRQSLTVWTLPNPCAGWVRSTRGRITGRSWIDSTQPSDLNSPEIENVSNGRSL